MLGLFGTLNLGTRALVAHQQGVQVAGHNLANVNNPAYARQRLNLQTSTPIGDSAGILGTGVDAGSIVSLRDRLVDEEMTSETSLTGSLESQQNAVRNAQTNLGEQVDQATGTSGAGGSHSLADGLANFFDGFQKVSADPTSLAARQVLLGAAASLTTQFNLIDHRLGALNTSLNTQVQTEVSQANALIGDLAGLNSQISKAESRSGGTANDLRDLRQQKLENLAHLVKIDSSTDDHGSLQVSVGGSLLISGNQIQDTLASYDGGGGQLLVRTATSGTNLSLTGGSLQGTMTARDGAVADLRRDLNSLAHELIANVNSIHSNGYDLSGNTGQAFFSGTNAADIQVNASLLADPRRLQAAGAAGATGNNTVALALAQFATQPVASLSNQTISQNYSKTVSGLGQALATLNTQQADQQVVTTLLTTQRNSLSGVSLDEEMTDLTRFQKAFAASARLITTVDDMLDTVINLKRG